MRSRAAAVASLSILAACRSPEFDGAKLDPIGTAVQASTTVCPTETVEGLDISSAQGTVDWTQVSGSGRVFAFIKATQGDYYTSSNWQAQWDGAGSAGLMRSAYHFFDPTIDGTAQAKYFLSVVGTLGPNDLPPMLDIECPTSSDESQTQSDCEYGGSSPDSGWAPASTINSGIQDFITYVTAQTGLTPILYSYNYWFSDSGADDTALMSDPFFISWPTTSSCYEVGLGNDYTSAAFWQWSVTGSCPGVSGEVDLDRFNGSLAQLQSMTVGATMGSSSGSSVASTSSGGGSGGAGGAGGTSGSSGGEGGGSSSASGNGGGRAVLATGAGGSSANASATSTGAAGAPVFPTSKTGCSCRTPSSDDAPDGRGAVLLALLGLAAARRRPR